MFLRPIHANTFGANGLVARWTSTTTNTWYSFDPMGNVANYIDIDGATSRIGFDAYGAAECGMPSGEVFGYQGQWGAYTDAVTGFVLLTHRYYDPQNGRFVTRDPIGQNGGINVYSYVDGDPVNFADPSGLVPSWLRDIGTSISKGGSKALNWGKGAVSCLGDDAETIRKAATTTESIVTGTFAVVAVLSDYDNSRTQAKCFKDLQDRIKSHPYHPRWPGDEGEDNDRECKYNAQMQHLLDLQAKEVNDSTLTFGLGFIVYWYK